MSNRSHPSNHSDTEELRADEETRRIAAYTGRTLSVSVAVALTEFNQLIIIKKLFFPLKETKDEDQINEQTQAGQKILIVTLK